jgi:colanic acid biosynthesis protein WcaH
MKHTEPRRVPRSAFRNLVRWAPIVSVDLILTNRRGEVLLGFRSNRPARHRWFVPGGRIFKNERIPDALARIARRETGVTLDPAAARFDGVYQHFYRDSVFGPSRTLPTHYVVLAFRASLRGNSAIQGDSQHRELAWFAPKELLRRASVHANTKAYFRSGPQKAGRRAQT